MHTDRPQAVSLFFSKVSATEKEKRVGKREKGGGGREEVLGGDLQLLQEYSCVN